MKSFLFLSMMLFVMSVYAQDNQQKDITDTQCDKVFTRCEEPPSLKNGTKEYQKLLTDYLNEKNQLPTEGSATFYLIISKTGEVLDVKIRENSIKEVENLVSAIKNFKNEWKAGKQNKRLVCAYVRVEIGANHNKIKVRLEG